MTRVLVGRNVTLRVLTPQDFPAWQEVRRRSARWLAPWEPLRTPGEDPVEEPHAFVARCEARYAEIAAGSGYGLGVFAEGVLAGEVNLAQVHRGALQGGTVGYWVDADRAGEGLIPQSLVLLERLAFEELGLHRLEANVMPSNTASRRVMEKLGWAEEGMARRLVCIAGRWEDHLRYSMCAEEWSQHREGLLAEWVY